MNPATISRKSQTSRRARLSDRDISSWTGRRGTPLLRLLTAWRRIAKPRTPRFSLVSTAVALTVAFAGCYSVVAPSDYPGGKRATTHNAGWQEAPTLPVRLEEAKTEPKPAKPAEPESLVQARAALQKGDDAAAHQGFARFLRSDAGSGAARDEARAGLAQATTKLYLSGRPAAGTTTHKIAWGETLSHIAVKYRSSSGLIALQNGITDPAKIRANQVLHVLPGPPVIKVSRSRHTLDLFWGEIMLFEYPAGLGQGGKTPAGEFTITELRTKPVWWNGGKRIAYGSKENPLGERWLGFEDTDAHTGLGIHGTNDPASIGKDVSQGCIRLHNDDVIALFNLVPRNTKVIITD